MSGQPTAKIGHNRGRAGKYTGDDMISNHIKNGFWLWSAACGVLWVCSKQPLFQQFADQMARVATIGFLGGAVFVAIALWIVGYKERLLAAKRFTELYERVQSGETVEIRGGSGLPRLIVLSAFGWVIVVGLSEQWMLQLYFGIAVATLSFFELLTIIPLLRQPILRISRESLESPIFGKLSWQDIQGFELGKAEFRAIGFHYRLDLSIRSLPSRTAQLHPAMRLKHRIHSIFRPSTRLRVRLLRASEMPKVILTLCQRTSSASTQESQRERAMEEIKAEAGADAVGLVEWMRQQKEQVRKRQDEAWEWRITPPPELMRTHWTTWVATVVVAALLAGFIYLLYSAAL